MTYLGQFLTDQAHSTSNANHLSLAIFLLSHFTLFALLGTSWSIELKRTVRMNTGVFSVTFYLSLHVLLCTYLNYGSRILLRYIVNNDHYLCHWHALLSNITKTLPSTWISIKNHSSSFAETTVGLALLCSCISIQKQHILRTVTEPRSLLKSFGGSYSMVLCLFLYMVSSFFQVIWQKSGKMSLQKHNNM